jgi:hypothetical protein
MEAQLTLSKRDTSCRTESRKNPRSTTSPTHKEKRNKSTLLEDYGCGLSRLRNSANDNGVVVVVVFATNGMTQNNTLDITMTPTTFSSPKVKVVTFIHLT